MKQEILSKLLSKALQLWLRSQVSHVSTLELAIHGTNQQLLSGEIPQVDLAANQAVYQDLHLSEVSLSGQNIKINLRQILQGKPIKLLEPIPLTGALTLTASDLQASLAAPLLATALKDLLQTLLGSRPDLQIPSQVDWQQADIGAGSLKLVGSYSVSSSSKSARDGCLASPEINPDSEPEIRSVILKTGLTLAQPHQLCLTPLEISFSDDSGAIVATTATIVATTATIVATTATIVATTATIELESFSLDLGQDVAIEELLVTEGQLTCHGKLTVQP